MKASSIQRTVTAIVLYGVFACWAFWPYLNQIKGAQYFFIFNCFAAAVGAYILSRRWIFSIVASILAGAIYGFGAYSMSLLCYHPFAGLVYAALPFSFMPAVYINRWKKIKPPAGTLAAGILSLLPFAFIIACFEIAAKRYLFAIPTDMTATGITFSNLILPFFGQVHSLPLGVFHFPLAGVIIGVVLFVEGKRLWASILLIASIFLSYYSPIANVPPVFWLSITMLMISILAGMGIQTLILAGKNDTRWIGIAGGVLIVAALLQFMFFRNKLEPSGIPISTQLYLLSAITVFTIFFMARANIAAHKLRAIMILLVGSIDVVITTVLLIRLVF